MMNIVERIKDWWDFLPTITHKRCRFWDAELKRLLDSGIVPSFGGYCLIFGNIEVWSENWPYAYGYLWPPESIKRLPSKSTAKRLRNLQLSLEQERISSLVTAELERSK